MSFKLQSPSPHSRDLLRSLLQQTRPGDYVVAVLFLLLSSTSFWMTRAAGGNSHSPPGRLAQVMVHNRLTRELDLQHPDTLSINGALGPVTLAIAAGGICVLASSCPNQFCVKQGAISRSHEMLVCVPGHLVVLIVGERGNELDAVTH